MNTVHVSRRALILTLTATALVLAGIVTAALTLTGGNADSAPTSTSTPTSKTPTTFTIVGHLEVASSCGRGGYSDIEEGTQVELTNQKREVLSVANLKKSSGYCRFEFVLSNVPRGHGMYGVTLGNTNRGTIWKTEQEASTGGFSLTLG